MSVIQIVMITIWAVIVYVLGGGAIWYYIEKRLGLGWHRSHSPMYNILESGLELFMFTIILIIVSAIGYGTYIAISG